MADLNQKHTYVVVAEGETDHCGLLCASSTDAAARAYVEADEYGYGQDLVVINIALDPS
jgi:hypothetical protein